jgi:uncharacterized protein YqeY
MLFDLIKLHHIDLRKSKRNLAQLNMLTYILGELDKGNRDHSDANVIAIINKTKKQLSEYSLLTKEEEEVLDIFLPQPLSDEELVDYIKKGKFSTLKELMSSLPKDPTENARFNKAKLKEIFTKLGE